MYNIYSNGHCSKQRVETDITQVPAKEATVRAREAGGFREGGKDRGRGAHIFIHLFSSIAISSPVNMFLNFC